MQQFQEQLTEIDLASGARELRGAIDANLLRIVDLPEAGNLVATALGAAAGQADMSESFGGMAWAWASKVIQLLEDSSQRVILDPAARDLVQSMVDSGLVSILPEVAEKSRAAHLGSGFIGRLPAFPDAPFDELLDLRAELSGPLTRYRGSVVRMSKSLTASPFEQAITAEADDLWVEQVAPALTDLEDAFTEHGLVKELARRVGCQNSARVLRWLPRLVVLVDKAAEDR